MFLIALLLLQSAAAGQVQRGEALFFDQAAGCGACHALKGKGTAVGPDLRGIGRVSPRAISMAIRATATQYVQVVKLKGGGTSFPGMPAQQDDKVVQVYDLSKTPPELRKLDRATEFDVFRPNDSWKHPPSATKLTDEQMADVIAYVRYAATGRKEAVDPADAK